VSLILGVCLISLQLLQLARLLFPSLPNFKRVDAFLTAGTIKYESRMKQACSHKVNIMIRNALDLHKITIDQQSVHGSSRQSSRGANYGQILLNYQRQQEKREKCGGIMWGWKRLWTGKLSLEDGIWIHARLVSSNLAQWFICIFFICATFYILRTRTLDGYVNIVRHRLLQYFTVYDWQFNLFLLLGGLAGLSGTLFCAIPYIPSHVSTVLQYRTGARPSLHDKDFLYHRYAGKLQW
jgi:hypothetical protein